MFIIINFKLIRREFQGPMAVVINENTHSITIQSGRNLQIMNIYGKYTNLEFESNEECSKAYEFIMEQIGKYINSAICEIKEERVHHDIQVGPTL